MFLDVIIDCFLIIEVEVIEIYEDELGYDDFYYGGFYDDIENVGFVIISYWYNVD